jgi:hypothetical protein
MKRTIIAVASMLIATSPGFAMESLSAYGWKNRVLVLFGKAGDPKLARQVETLRNQTGELENRDMVVLQVSDGKVVSIYGDAPRLDAVRLKAETKVEGNAFQVVLVGKDGGVKLRSSDVVGNVEIFDLIDRMPMRKAGQD